MSEKKPMKCKVKNSHGEPIAADQDGNNVAFICQNCGYPVLMSQHMHPNGEIHCRGCEHEYRVNCRLNALNQPLIGMLLFCR